MTVYLIGSKRDTSSLRVVLQFAYASFDRKLPTEDQRLQLST